MYIGLLYKSTRHTTAQTTYSKHTSLYSIRLSTTLTSKPSEMSLFRSRSWLMCGDGYSIMLISALYPEKHISDAGRTAILWESIWLNWETQMTKSNQKNSQSMLYNLDKLSNHNNHSFHAEMTSSLCWTIAVIDCHLFTGRGQKCLVTWVVLWNFSGRVNGNYQVTLKQVTNRE